MSINYIYNLTKFAFPPLPKRQPTYPYLPLPEEEHMINHPPEKLLTKHLKNSPKFSPKNGPKNSPKNSPTVQRSNGPVHILTYALMHHLYSAALYQSTRRLNFVRIRPRTEQEITKSLISSR